MVDDEMGLFSTHEMSEDKMSDALKPSLYENILIFIISRRVTQQYLTKCNGGNCNSTGRMFFEEPKPNRKAKLKRSLLLM